MDYFLFALINKGSSKYMCIVKLKSTPTQNSLVKSNSTVCFSTEQSSTNEGVMMVIPELTV